MGDFGPLRADPLQPPSDATRIRAALTVSLLAPRLEVERLLVMLGLIRRNADGVYELLLDVPHVGELHTRAFDGVTPQRLAR